MFVAAAEDCGCSGAARAGPALLSSLVLLLAAVWSLIALPGTHTTVAKAYDPAAGLSIETFGCDIDFVAGDAARLRLAVGEQVEFLLLHYLESQANGAVFRPRLVGFSSEADRAFFELLTARGLDYRFAEAPADDYYALLAICKAPAFDGRRDGWEMRS